MKRSSEFVRGKASFAEVFWRCTELVCAVIGPCQAETVEAAHIRVFAKHGIHELRDGISLRADIHQLFGAGRVAIDPDKLVLITHPGLDRYPNWSRAVALRSSASSVGVSLGPMRTAMIGMGHRFACRQDGGPWRHRVSGDEHDVFDRARPVSTLTCTAPRISLIAPPALPLLEFCCRPSSRR